MSCEVLPRTLPERLEEPSTAHCRKLSRILIPHLNAAKTVLDVGCGPGTITAELARIRHEGTTIGIDSSEEVIAVATADYPKSARPNLSFRVGNALNLPFDDNSFDLVHAHQVLLYTGDPAAGIREMRRVCIPGGIVAAREADLGRPFGRQPTKGWKNGSLGFRIQ